MEENYEDIKLEYENFKKTVNSEEGKFIYIRDQLHNMIREKTEWQKTATNLQEEKEKYMSNYNQQMNDLKLKKQELDEKLSHNYKKELEEKDIIIKNLNKNIIRLDTYSSKLDKESEANKKSANEYSNSKRKWKDRYFDLHNKIDQVIEEKTGNLFTTKNLLERDLNECKKELNHLSEKLKLAQKAIVIESDIKSSLTYQKCSKRKKQYRQKFLEEQTISSSLKSETYSKSEYQKLENEKKALQMYIDQQKQFINKQGEIPKIDYFSWRLQKLREDIKYFRAQKEDSNLIYEALPNAVTLLEESWMIIKSVLEGNNEEINKLRGSMNVLTLTAQADKSTLVLHLLDEQDKLKKANQKLKDTITNLHLKHLSEKKDLEQKLLITGKEVPIKEEEVTITEEKEKYKKIPKEIKTDIKLDMFMEEIIKEFSKGIENFGDEKLILLLSKKVNKPELEIRRQLLIQNRLIDNLTKKLRSYQDHFFQTFKTMKTVTALDKMIGHPQAEKLISLIALERLAGCDVHPKKLEFAIEKKIKKISISKTEDEIIEFYVRSLQVVYDLIGKKVNKFKRLEKFVEKIESQIEPLKIDEPLKNIINNVRPQNIKKEDRENMIDAISEVLIQNNVDIEENLGYGISLLNNNNHCSIRTFWIPEIELKKKEDFICTFDMKILKQVPRGTYNDLKHGAKNLAIILNNIENSRFRNEKSQYYMIGKRGTENTGIEYLVIYLNYENVLNVVIKISHLLKWKKFNNERFISPASVCFNSDSFELKLIRYAFDLILLSGLKQFSDYTIFQNKIGFKQKKVKLMGSFVRL